jgi:hypothetical protein
VVVERVEQNGDRVVAGELGLLRSRWSTRAITRSGSASRASTPM